MGQVGVFLSQHPYAQQESATVGGVKADDVAVNVGSLQDDIIHHQSQHQQHGLKQGVVVGFFDLFLAHQESEIDVAERRDKRKEGHMGNQIGVQLRIEQPNSETHHHGDECRPYR